MILLISYDLNGHEKPEAYQKVEDKIRANVNVGNYIKMLRSQWLIDTNQSVDSWHKLIGSAVDGDDRWLVNQLTSNHSGFLNQAVVDWLKVREA